MCACVSLSRWVSVWMIWSLSKLSNHTFIFAKTNHRPKLWVQRDWSTKKKTGEKAHFFVRIWHLLQAWPFLWPTLHLSLHLWAQLSSFSVLVFIILILWSLSILYISDYYGMFSEANVDLLFKQIQLLECICSLCWFTTNSPDTNSIDIVWQFKVGLISEATNLFVIFLQIVFFHQYLHLLYSLQHESTLWKCMCCLI